jgi:hypothetical protein
MASAGEKPAETALSPLRAGRAVRLAADPPPGANGALTPSVRFASTPAEMMGPKWNARSPTSRPTFAASAPAVTDAPPLSDFVPFIAGEASDGEPAAACARSFIIEAALKANGKAAKSALSLSSE